MEVFLQTFCWQMNVRDSEALSGLSRYAGYNLVDSQEDADVILFSIILETIINSLGI